MHRIKPAARQRAKVTAAIMQALRSRGRDFTGESGQTAGESLPLLSGEGSSTPLWKRRKERIRREISRKKAAVPTPASQVRAAKARPKTSAQ